MIVLDAIKRAARMIGIIAEGEAPDAAQGEAMLSSLNGMLAAWEGEGIRLALPALALADTVPLTANHDDAICFNLAVNLAGEYGRQVNPAIAKRAEDTLRQLQNAYAYVPTLMCEPELVRSRRRLNGQWGIY